MLFLREQQNALFTHAGRREYDADNVNSYRSHMPLHFCSCILIKTKGAVVSRLASHRGSELFPPFKNCISA